MYSSLLLFIGLCSCVFLVPGDATSRLTDREHPPEDCRSGTTCLKLELLRLASRLANITRVAVGPGVALVSTDRTEAVTDRFRQLAVSSLPLRHFLGQLVSDFIASLNLTLQLGDSTILPQLKEVGFQLLDSSPATGRAKYRRSWYALGMIGAVGFALLSALSGKALMASLLALAMSAIVALRSGGFASNHAFSSPGKVMEYEIITRPAYSNAPANYYDQEHLHHHTVASQRSYGKRNFEGSRNIAEHVYQERQ